MSARGEATRNHILDVAEQMYGARGINGVSLREIRLAAGARNTAAMQFHFGDRDGVLQALVDRHMPRIAVIQQDLFDRMLADGRGNDARSLVEVLVRPSAEYLTRGPSERSWVKIMSSLGAEPDLHVDEMLAVAPQPAALAGAKLYEILGESTSDEIALERMVALIQCAVHLCGDRARIEDDLSLSRPHGPVEVFIENLVDMIHAALFAPVTPVRAADIAVQP